MNTPDWALIRAFYATAEHGSLSAASRALGLTQPTLSRQVAELERQLSLTLFERAGKRLVLTETGAALFKSVRPMQDAALEFSLTAAGHSMDEGGLVTISASDVYAAHILPPFMSKLQSVAPQVRIAILSSNSLSDLRRREADIAIRHVRPSEDELIGKLVATTGAHFYASQRWVEKHGFIRNVEDIPAQEMLGAVDANQYADYLQSMGIAARVEDFRILSENSVVLWEIAKQGNGICAMISDIADKTEGMVRLLPNLAAIPVPLWLVTHRELRTSKRIRLVFDCLAEELAAQKQ